MTGRHGMFAMRVPWPGSREPESFGDQDGGGLGRSGFERLHTALPGVIHG